MNPPTADEFYEALRAHNPNVNRKSEISATDVRVGLGMNPHIRPTQAEWLERAGLRITATRAARRGQRAYTTVYYVSKALSDPNSLLIQEVKAYNPKSRPKAELAPVPTPTPTPVLDQEEDSNESEDNAPSPVLQRELVLIAHRLDSMQLRLQIMQRIYSEQIDRLDRKLQRLLEIWGEPSPSSTQVNGEHHT